MPSVDVAPNFAPDLFPEPSDADIPSPSPAGQADADPQFFDWYRQNHPKETADLSDYTIARNLYPDWRDKDESFPAFATRVGLQQGALGTLLNTGLSSAALHLNEPIESGISGIGSALHGGSFSEGYKTKRQELEDQRAVGGFQNPNADLAGNALGLLADYARLGPAVRKAGDFIPGISAVGKNGPLGDAIVKLFGLSTADEIPKVIERESLNPKGTDVGAALGDVGKAGLEGAASAVIGSGISKGLTAAIAPNLRSIGSGMAASDQIAAGLPRSIATRGLQKLGQGYVGEVSPTQKGFDIDKAYYDTLLSNSGINVQKGLTDLGDRMTNRPGWASKVMEAAQQALPGAAELIPGDGSEVIGKDALQAAVTRLNASDPSGNLTRNFIADIYKKIIPDRLSGPFDPDASFDRNAISGRLTDQGKLVPPPVTGMGAFGNLFYERSGGGAGRALWPLITSAPIPVVKQTAAIVSQLPSGVMRAGGGLMSKLGGLASMAGEPGTAAADALTKRVPSAVGEAINGNLQKMPNFYQNGAYQMLTGDNTPLFPDQYHPPAQHADATPSGNVQQWLGSVDRQTGTNYITAKLGAKIGQQLAETDDSGYKVALFNLASTPENRAALAHTDPQQP